MTPDNSPRPSFLLVHGGMHGAWCWERLEAELAAESWQSEAIDLPTALRADTATESLPGMHDDVRVISERLESIEGPVVVVAHSYGGVPVTQAIADAPNVSHVVYLASLPLDIGESMFGFFGGPGPEAMEARLPPPPNARETLFSDMSDDDADRAARRLVAHSARSAWEKVTKAGWRHVDSSFIICEQDRTMPPQVQEQMARRAGSTVYRMDAGHSPFLSMPDALATLLTIIAGRRGARSVPGDAPTTHGRSPS